MEKDFQEIFKKGRGFRESFLFLKVLKNETGISRFGFIVTKKASKKSVVRNKIKRKISEAVRETMPKLKRGWDGILIVSQPLTEKNIGEIEKGVARLFKKAKLI